jgi:hypothetical protein
MKAALVAGMILLHAAVGFAVGYMMALAII